MIRIACFKQLVAVCFSCSATHYKLNAPSRRFADISSLASYGTAMVSEAEGTERIEHKTNFFANLLSLSGHAMLRSWWLELYEAACKSNWPKAEKLYEAGLR